MVRTAENTERGEVVKSRLLLVMKVVLWLVIGYSFATDMAFYKTHPRLGQVVYGLNTFLTGSVLISIGRFVLISVYRRQNKKNNRVRGNYILGITQIATLLNVIFLVLGLMLVFGINPKEFLTSITIVAAAIALVFRDYITNMISGLLIMFSDQFTIGDTVRIGDHQGKIIDITLANILIKNEDDDIVLIPNNTAFTTNIVNQSLQNSRKLTLDFELPLAHVYQTDTLKRNLEAVAEKHASDVVSDSFQLKVVGVGKDFVHFKLQLTMLKKDTTLRRQIRNELYQQVIASDAEQSATKPRN